jgi:hypothetical protein
MPRVLIVYALLGATAVAAAEHTPVPPCAAPTEQLHLRREDDLRRDGLLRGGEVLPRALPPRPARWRQGRHPMRITLPLILAGGLVCAAA